MKIIALCLLSTAFLDFVSCHESTNQEEGGRYQEVHRSCGSIKAANPSALSGVYTIQITRGLLQVYCEMAINGGGYTFLSIEGVAKLIKQDLGYLFTDKSNVLLRIAKPDGTQPFTVIQTLKSQGVLSVQLSQHTHYKGPVNKKLGPYLFLGTLPVSAANMKSKQGFKSNGREISFYNCDANPNSYFSFFPNSKEQSPSSGSLGYERHGVAVNWRASAKRPPSGRRIPLDFFLFTEMHFGGCGCYSTSDNWLNSISVHPALGTAIGIR